MSSEAFGLRPAVTEDAEVATRLAIRAKASWGYPAEWIEAWRDELTITAAMLSEHRGFVVEDGDTPVAVAVLADRGSDWSLEHLWVDPDRQRRGIGAMLLRHVLTAAAAVHGGPCEVISDPGAVPFYLRHGAVAVGSLPAPMPGVPERVLPVLHFPDVANRAA